MCADSEIFVYMGFLRITKRSQPNPLISHYAIKMILPIGTLGSVGSLLAATLYQGNPDRNHKL
jgi:purine-nucleoside phosphorylase